MCGMPACNTRPMTKRIQTTVPGANPVDVIVCPDCDVRICGHKPRGAASGCDRKVADPFAKRCSLGHWLAGQ